MYDLLHLKTMIRTLIRRELRATVVGIRRAPVGAVEDISGGKVLTATGYPGSAGDEQLRAALAEPFGHASHPPSDCGLVLVRVAGQWVVVAAEDRQYRPSLQSGEVAIYNEHNASIVLKADGTIVLNEGSANVARVGDSVTGTVTTPLGGSCTISLSIASNSATVKA